MRDYWTVQGELAEAQSEYRYWARIEGRLQADEREAKRRAALRVSALERELARMKPPRHNPTLSGVEKVLGAMAYSSTDLRVSDIAHMTGLSEGSVRRHLKQLVDEGVVWESSGLRSAFERGQWTKKKVPRTYTIAHGVYDDPRIPDDWHDVFVGY